MCVQGGGVAMYLYVYVYTPHHIRDCNGVRLNVNYGERIEIRNVRPDDEVNAVSCWRAYLHVITCFN